MSPRVKIVINWLATVLVISTNYLANSLPINGISTAGVSDMFPNFFVPAGYTFGIWGLIFLLHLLFAGYCTYVLSNPSRAKNPLGMLAQKISPLYWLACLLNSGWLLAWHHLYIGASVIIMIGLLLTLLAIFRILTISEKTLELGYFDHISLETPFIIYFSWIAVALIANVTAYLVSIFWLGGGLEQWKWSCIMITAAGALGVWFSLRWHRPAYTAVIVWAIIGIYVKQGPLSVAIKYNSLAAIAICLTAAIIGFWYKRKLLFKTKTQFS